MQLVFIKVRKVNDRRDGDRRASPACGWESGGATANNLQLVVGIRNWELGIRRNCFQLAACNWELGIGNWSAISRLAGQPSTINDQLSTTKKASPYRKAL
jgi:hypothetical protein